MTIEDKLKAYGFLGIEFICIGEKITILRGEEPTEEELQNALIQLNTKKPTSDDYLLDLDFRLSMIELGL